VHKLSPVYGLLFAAAAPFMSPFLFVKLLAFPLLLVTIYYLYRISQTFLSPRTAFRLCVVSSAIIILVDVDFGVISGLQRAFTAPLLLALIFYLMAERYWRAALVVILSVIYPPIFVLSVVTFLLVLLRKERGSRWVSLNWQHFRPLMFSALLGALLLLPAFTAVPPAEGDRRNEVAKTAFAIDPMFREGGRYPLLEPSPLNGPGGIIDDGMDGFITIIAVTFALSSWLVARSRAQAVPHVLKQLLWAGFLCFAAAWVAILVTGTITLHMPNRYTRFPLLLLPLVFLWLNGKESIRTSARWLQTQGSRLVLFLVIPVLAASAFLLSQPLSATLKLLTAGLMVSIIVLSAIVSRRTQLSAPGHSVSVSHLVMARSSNWKQSALDLGLVLSLIWFIWAFDEEFYAPPVEDMPLLTFIESLQLTHSLLEIHVRLTTCLCTQSGLFCSVVKPRARILTS
jgi:hypothetical protein